MKTPVNTGVLRGKVRWGGLFSIILFYVNEK
jgi:hypothetical protein